MKKQIPNIILIILLAIISVLVIYANGSVIAPNEDGKANDGLENNPEVPNIPEIPPKDEEIEEVKYPISSQVDDNYNFNQELNNISNFYGYITFHEISLLISDFNGGIKVSIIDEKLNIINEKIIVKSATYLTSKITIDGIAIVYNSDNKTHLTTMDKSLKILNTVSFEKSLDASIYSYSDSYLLILGNQIYTIRDNKILNEKSMASQTHSVIKDINGYIFITKNVDGYYLKKLSPNLDIIHSTEHKEGTLLDFAMIVENSNSYFILAEKVSNCIFIKKLNKSFGFIDEVALGKGKDAKISLLQGTLAVTVTKINETTTNDIENNKIYLMQYDLEFSNNEQNINKIIYTQIYKDTLYMMTESSEKSILTSFSNKAVTKNYIFEKSSFITFLINTNNTITIIRFEGSKIKLVNLNI